MIYRMLVPGYDPIDYDNNEDAIAAALVRARDAGAEVRVQKLEQLVSHNLISVTTVQIALEDEHE